MGDLESGCASLAAARAIELSNEDRAVLEYASHTPLDWSRTRIRA